MSTGTLPPAAEAHPSRLAPVDGMRALAAGAVVVYHLLLFTVGVDSASAEVWGYFNFGVAVFFVLSGFLLFRPYVAAGRALRSPPGLRAFAARRIARIVPAYWALLLVVAPLSLAAVEVANADWWRWFGFAQIYRDDTIGGGLGPAWSICIELTFYASLPLVAAVATWLARRRPVPYGTYWALLAVLVSADLAYRALEAPGSSATPQAEQTNLLSTYAWFAAGMALAVLDVRREERGTLPAWLATAARGRVAWPAAVALFAAGALVLDQSDAFMTSHPPGAHLLIAVASGLVVMPILRAHEPGGLLRALASPVPAFLGLVSYGVYLWNVPVLDVLTHHFTVLGTFVNGLVGVGITVLVAWLSYRIVERPAMQAARRVR